MELTPEEKRAVASLKRLSRTWPESLWLFSNGMDLNVMKKNDAGERAISETGGFDTNYVVATVTVESDGGDW